MSQLEFINASKSYGTVRALADFTLSLRSGQLVTLLGPSGCGKTTALRVAAGFESMDSGRLLANGHVISHVPAQKRDMGMVFQNYSLFPHMTVFENVSYGLRVRGVEPQSRRTRTDDMLSLVQLAELGGRYPHQLSGGQQQRVALARALVVEPSVLLLDEPLSALDARVRVEVRDVIRDLQRRLGTTTLFVTHDQEEALSISDVVCVMDCGQVQQVGTPTEIYNNPANTFVATFVGDSVSIPTSRGNRLARPENLSVSPVGSEPLPGEMQFDGQVTAIEFHGATTTVRVRRIDNDTSVSVRMLQSAESSVTTGDSVVVTVHRFITAL